MAKDDTVLAETFQALTTAGRAIRRPVREPWIFDSLYSKANKIDPILMSINPSSAAFSQSKRISTARKTIGGTTFFHWSDKTGRNLDPLIITFAGETGPISGLGKDTAAQDKTSIITLAGKTHPGALRNAQNWARFYTLTAQPQIDPKTLKPNVWTIRYRSLIFPDVTFRGFFNSVLQFTDDAMNPFSKKYSVTFTVTGVTPDILVLKNLIGKVDINIAAKSDTGATPT